MIVVFGSINVDIVVPVPKLPAPGETVLGGDYKIVAGGKGANQALAAARAGARVAMIGRVGQDGFADIALADLKAGGVDLAGVASGAEATGLAVICFDPAGENQIAVASGANRAVRERQVPDSLLTPDTVVVMQMEVPTEENWALAERARARRTRLLLNVAPAGAIPKSALAGLDWMIVNELEVVDCAKMFGRATADPLAAGRRLVEAAGVGVVVTLGSEGAAVLTRQAAWRIGTLPITPVDSTAAGDAFVGAFAAALDRGAEPPVALRWGSVAGGLACLVEGAQPSLPTRAAIEARLPDLPPAVPF